MTLGIEIYWVISVGKKGERIILTIVDEVLKE